MYDRLISPERSEFLPGTRLAESLLEIPTPRMRFFSVLSYETEFVLFWRGWNILSCPWAGTAHTRQVNLSREVGISTRNEACRVSAGNSDSEDEIYFSFLRDRICSIFGGAGNFCLAHGPGQLTRDVKCDVRILNFRGDAIHAPPRKTPNDIRKTSLCEAECQR